MSYQEWRRRMVAELRPWNITFWEIVDREWTPAEQNELARLWKAWAPGD